MVKKYGDREWFDTGEWYPHMGVLACEDIVAELKEVIEKRDRYCCSLRILAIEIARQGKLEKLSHVISARVTDYEENQILLSAAGRALVELDLNRVTDLKAWLDLPKDIDPDNTLLAQALDTLWPEHIDLDSLIKHLRPQKDYYSVGRYRMFLLDLPKRLTSEQRPQVLSALAEELANRVENRKKNQKGTPSMRDRPLFASDFFGDLLSIQLEDWNAHLDHIPVLERWLDIFDNAKKYGLLHEREHAKAISLHIEKAHELRRELCRYHVLRYHGEKADPQSFYWYVSKSVYPRREDVGFWQETLKIWEKEYPDLVPIAWHALIMAWRAGDYSSDIMEWIEKCSEQNHIIRKLWDRDRQRSLDGEDAKWRQKDALLKKQEQEKRRKNVQEVNKNISKIRSGDEYSLYWLTVYHYENTEDNYDPRVSQTDAIQKEFGQKVSDAYLEGLQAYCSKVQLPELSDYYLTNSTPWPIILVLQAIDSWQRNTEANWSDLPRPLKQTALQAGLSGLNDFPEWYTELVAEEEEAARNLWFKALDLEAGSSNDYPHLANLLAHNKDFELCRAVALEYLMSHPDVCLKAIKPLIRCILTDNLSDRVLDFLQKCGLRHIERGNELQGISFLAATWRYRQEEVWNWIDQNYLNDSDSRSSSFTRWVLTIEEIHSDFRMDHWPAWVKEEVLLSMLTDFLALKLPKLTGGGVVSEPVRLRFLRDDCINKIAESGNPAVAQGLISLIEQPQMAKYRNLLLNVLDRCHKASAGNIWAPLSPVELWEFIGKDKRPVRSHKELFDLSLEIVNDVKLHIQSGDSNLKRLCWRDDFSKERPKEPRKEETLQIIFFDKIKTHPLHKKIFGVREVEITGGKRPDIMIACRTPQGKALKVYIEMKRQRNEGLITAITEQLANKYLIDPEAPYGIYLVGWFGPDYYGPSRRALREACGHVPVTAETLESCLQQLCDQVAAERYDIDAIRAVVVDLKLAS